jgi:hypothetical protein
VRGQLAVHRAQLFDERPTRRGREAGGNSRRESFEMSDEGIHLLAILHREWRDDQPTFAAAAHGVDESLLLEAMERTAYRRPTQSQPLGDDALGDAGSRGELAPDDHAP